MSTQWGRVSAYSAPRSPSPTHGGWVRGWVEPSTEGLLSVAFVTLKHVGDLMVHVPSAGGSRVANRGRERQGCMKQNRHGEIFWGCWGACSQGRVLMYQPVQVIAVVCMLALCFCPFCFVCTRRHCLVWKGQLWRCEAWAAKAKVPGKKHHH